MTSCSDSGCSPRDLLGRRTALVLWILPAALIVLGAALPTARSLLWIPCFTLMGASCLLNVSRCGRLHCYLTGPLFLLAAVITTLDALHVVSVDWRWTFAIALLGTVGAFGLERVRGTYVT